MQELRPLNAIVGMAELEDLDTVKADPLFDAMIDADIDPNKRSEVINRLLNAKIEAAGIVHPAKVLARSNSYLKGSSITFRHHRDGALNGILGQAYESDCGDVALEINGEFRVVAGNVPVKVFPKKQEESGLRPGPYPWGAPRPGMGTLHTAYSPPTRSEVVRRYHDLVPDDRPDFVGNAWTLLHHYTYRGRTLQISPKIKGVVTDIQTDNEGKLVFVIDGIMYKRNRYHIVKMWDKKEN